MKKGFLYSRYGKDELQRWKTIYCTNRHVNIALRLTRTCPLTYVTSTQKVKDPSQYASQEGPPVSHHGQRLIPAQETAWPRLARLFQLFTGPRPWPEAVQLFYCCSLYTSSLYWMKKTWRKARCDPPLQISEFTSWIVKLSHCRSLVQQSSLAPSPDQSRLVQIMHCSFWSNLAPTSFVNYENYPRRLIVFVCLFYLDIKRLFACQLVWCKAVTPRISRLRPN